MPALRAGLALVLLAGACRGVSPLTNRIAVGTDPFVVLVGEGPDGWTDLFAAAADGGEVVRFTYTRHVESAPALDPSGGVAAFLRRHPTDSGRAPTLVVMNLVNSAEREIAVPAALGTPRRVGWSPDGRLLYLEADSGLAATPAPPAAPALERLAPGDTRWAQAESSLAVLLGTPAFARVTRCDDDPAAWCVVTVQEEVERLEPTLRDPFRWGSDSLGYFEGTRLIIRPLAGGRSRMMDWSRPPAAPRQAAYWSP